MKRLFTIVAVVLFGHIAGVSHVQAGENVDQAWVKQNFTSMPVAFTQNIGSNPLKAGGEPVIDGVSQEREPS